MITITPGIVIVHESAPQWGAGKVVTVTAGMATIEFSDGKSRKIASSHFGALMPSDHSSWVPIPDATPETVKPKRAARAKKL